MAQVISLFNNLKDAEEVVNALDSSEIGKNERWVIDEWGDGREAQTRVMPMPSGEPDVAGAPPAQVSRDLDLSDDEEKFLRRAVQNGGTLVVIEVDDGDEAATAKRIFGEQDGRIVGE